ncbi:hypothetical protein [Paenibacillus sp. NFR01]|nr:hypothetical protein [Paenibacillus sp. NFR01]
MIIFNIVNFRAQIAPPPYPNFGKTSFNVLIVAVSLFLIFILARRMKE